jgi:hypothetical protein
MRSEKDQLESPIMLAVPDQKHISGEEHNYMMNWSEQKDFGTKKGFLGMKKGTTGRFLSYEDFSKQASEIQSK